MTKVILVAGSVRAMIQEGWFKRIEARLAASAHANLLGWVRGRVGLIAEARFLIQCQSVF
jgi:hypothetical protein